MDIKKLPIVFDAKITCDCLMYYRLSIIETSSKGRAWLSSHINIFLNQNNIAGFGDDDLIYRPNYYNDILLTEEINMWSVTPENIIDMIINELEEDNYIIAFLGRYENDIFARHHEYLFYGFNRERKIFYCSCPQDGKFTETIVSFDFVSKGYKFCYNYFKNELAFLMNKRNFIYPITRYRLRSDYNDDNALTDAIVKIDREVIGKSFHVYENDIDKNITFEYKVYTGISCLIGIEHVLTEGTQKGYMDEQMLINVKKSMLFMLDFRKLLHSNLEWVLEKMNIKDKLTNELVEKYKNHYIEFEKSYNILCKYQYLWETRPLDLLEKVVDRIKNQFRNEKKTLDTFIDTVRPIYIQSLGYEYYEKSLKDKT